MQRSYKTYPTPERVESYMTYMGELTWAMAMLADHPHAVFMGQAVAVPGTGMFRTLAQVPMSQRVELPVAEDMQLGMATGAALRGDLPICIYPRWNFLLLATSQLVLHLDKMPFLGFHPKVIIRTAVATDEPMDPGVQHLGNFSSAYKSMLRNVRVVELRSAHEIVPAYGAALDARTSTILVEFHSAYD